MTEKEFRAKERRSGAEKSVKKRKKKKGIKVLFTVLLLLAVMLVAAISVVAYNVFKIETISVVGNTVYDSAKIIETAELEIGDSLLFIGEKKLSEKLSAELPYISEIKIKRELPTGLTINVTETYEEQFFYRNSVFYSADKNGKILNQYYEKNENLPVTIATEDDKIETGYDYLAANEMQANLQKEISAFAKQNNINVMVVNATDIYRAYFIIDDKTLVLLGSSTYLERKLEFLPKTLKSMEQKECNVIDISNWSPDNNEAISYEKDINSYFVFK